MQQGLCLFEKGKKNWKNCRRFPEKSKILFFLENYNPPEEKARSCKIAWANNFLAIPSFLLYVVSMVFLWKMVRKSESTKIRCFVKKTFIFFPEYFAPVLKKITARKELWRGLHSERGHGIFFPLGELKFQFTLYFFWIFLDIWKCSNN